MKLPSRAKEVNSVLAATLNQCEKDKARAAAATHNPPRPSPCPAQAPQPAPPPWLCPAARALYTQTHLRACPRAQARLELDPAGDRIHCEGFALRIFDNADRVDRAGKATERTCKAFYAASVFIEVTALPCR
jgi:hypothetical protein